jgi:hypothetical protein
MKIIRYCVLWTLPVVMFVGAIRELPGGFYYSGDRFFLEWDIIIASILGPLFLASIWHPPKPRG